MATEPTWYIFLLFAAPGDQQQTDKQHQGSGCHRATRCSHCCGIQRHGDQVCHYGVQSYRSHCPFTSRNQIHRKHSNNLQWLHKSSEKSNRWKLSQQSGLSLYRQLELVTSQVRVMQKPQQRRKMVNNTLVTLRGWICACAFERTKPVDMYCGAVQCWYKLLLWGLFDILAKRSKYEHQRIWLEILQKNTWPVRARENLGYYFIITALSVSQN